MRSAQAPCGRIVDVAEEACVRRLNVVCSCLLFAKLCSKLDIISDLKNVGNRLSIRRDSLLGMVYARRHAVHAERRK